MAARVRFLASEPITQTLVRVISFWFPDVLLRGLGADPRDVGRGELGPGEVPGVFLAGEAAAALRAGCAAATRVPSGPCGVVWLAGYLGAKTKSVIPHSAMAFLITSSVSRSGQYLRTSQQWPE